MIDRDTRVAILKLLEQGHGVKTIARALGVSKNTVRRVRESGQADVPRLERPERLGDREELVRSEYVRCNGNLVRVHEELAKQGVVISYPALTDFCRRHGIGVKPKRAAGRYHFEPGEEMQHDTSPHRVRIGGKVTLVQCAALVLCFSRMIFAQVYERWSRFEARVFLNTALQVLGGAASRCMLDNSSVIIVRGTGKDAIPAPEMKAIEERFGFVFAAHEVGDADRSARVERPFDYIERNFYAGRDFESVPDLNRQMAAWCERVNGRYKRHIRAVPLELYQVEQPYLRKLPVFVPEVYELHRRRVDVEGYVNLHTNRYSVDADLIGKDVEVRETIEQVRIFHGHALAAEHEKGSYGRNERSTLEQHRGRGRRRYAPAPPTDEERLLRAQGPAFGALIDALQRRYGGRAVRATRRLHRLWTEYPSDAVQAAVADAVAFGLTDLGRLERMVLRRVAGDFFNLPVEGDDG